MSLPDPSVLADSFGLVAGSGPFVEPIWAEVDYEVAVNVFQKAENASPPEWDRFYAAFNALYLPSLVFVMNNLPLDCSEEALMVTIALFTILKGCMVFKTSNVSPSFARFVRLETAKVLQLYTSLLRSIASASKVKELGSSNAILVCPSPNIALKVKPSKNADSLFSSPLQPDPYELIPVVTGVVIAIDTSVTSITTLPAIEPSVKKDLVVVVKQLETAHLSASDPFKRHYTVMYEIFDPIILHGSLDLRAIMPKQEEATMAIPWWNCELKRAGDEEVESCAQLEEGEEMRACSRCFAVRYCSRGASVASRRLSSSETLPPLLLLPRFRSADDSLLPSEHQRLDWKRHKLVCFKPSW
ncbi:hypothetical protein BDY24DRAFT_375813 [Mrakia frigida]|uniref:zinc finger MYND domain-containing protein n=1 Tax=Mrakia frigida TaxID=29902 RepID=UPI003FCC1D92